MGGRSQVSGVRGQVSGIRGQVSGVRGQDLLYASFLNPHSSFLRCQVSGVRGQVSGIRCQVSGVRGQDLLYASFLNPHSSFLRCQVSGGRSQVVGNGRWGMDFLLLALALIFTSLFPTVRLQDCTTAGLLTTVRLRHNTELFTEFHRVSKVANFYSFTTA